MKAVFGHSENEVIFIPKSGKDSYLKTSSYRPITKSSYVGKLLERILKKRIMHYLHSNDLDDVRQEGFRKRKSTARYITDLINNIQLAPQQYSWRERTEHYRAGVCARGPKEIGLQSKETLVSRLDICLHIVISLVDEEVAY